MIAQHQLFRIRMQVHLLVHPIGNRMPVQVMLQPVRSYVSGTISGTNPCRVSSMRPRSSNLPQIGIVVARQVILQEAHQMPDHFLHGFAGL
jgi:hypothetical protein